MSSTASIETGFSRLKTEWREILPLSAYVGLCFLIFGILKFGVLNFDWGRSAGYEAVLWLTAVAFLIFTLRVRMKNLPRPTKILLGSIFVSFAIYMAFPLTLPPDDGFNALTGLRLHYRQFILPTLCILGLWRPGFGAVALLGAICERMTLGSWFGDNLSKTEYFPLAEIGLFLTIAAALEPFTRRNPFLARAKAPLAPGDDIPLLTKITLLGVSLHLANYFYSAVAKALLGDHPLSWVLYNHTENMIPTHLQFGQLPLSVISGLPELSYVLFGSVYVLLNALIFFGQAFGLLAPLRIRWIVLIAAFYDLTHIAIYLVTGIFFYKWILLNISIIVAFRPLSDVRLPRNFQALSIAVLLTSPALFFTANLAWWDTLSVNHERIYAVLDDGSEIEVPSNYWGSFSIHYAQQRRSPELAAQALWPWRYGKPKEQRMAELANQCRMPLPEDDGKVEVDVRVGDVDGSIADHIRRHHAYILSAADAEGRIDFDFHPHHIFSAPWRYPQIYHVDVRHIRAYRFRDQAICLTLEDGQFQHRVVRERTFEIPIRK